jgi:hypothetical protein
MKRQGKTQKDMTRQDKTQQDKARQDKTRQGQERQGKAGWVRSYGIKVKSKKKLISYIVSCPFHFSFNFKL